MENTFSSSTVPLISVIVPIYNIAPFIHKCVESIQAQTYRNLEIILVDDGSIDESGTYCDEMAKSDSRIHVIHQANAGVSAARNQGLEKADGEYIVFVDGDDWVDEEYISSLYSVSQTHGGCDLVTAGFRSIQGEQIDIYCNEEAFIDIGTRTTPLEILGAPFSKLFRRDLIIRGGVKFNSALRNAEDEVFCYQYLPLCRNVCIMDLIHYNYVRHEDTATFRFNQQYVNCLRALFDSQILLIHTMSSVAKDVADAYIVGKGYYYFSLAYEYYISREGNKLSTFRMLVNTFHKEMSSPCNEALLTDKTRLFRSTYVSLIREHHTFLFWIYYRFRLFIGKTRRAFSGCGHKPR